MLKIVEKVRIDKWLWSVRVFKTRNLATEACKAGRVKINGKNCKPSKEINVGDRIFTTKNGIKYEYEVLALINKRVGAKIAVEAVKDHTPQELIQQHNFFHKVAAPERRDKGLGRPTKKERRKIDDHKSDEDDFEDWDDYEV